MPDQQNNTTIDTGNGWNIACLLGGVLLGILVTLGALHTWGCLAFGGPVGTDTVASVMGMVKDQKREVKEELGVFRAELDAWEHHIERRIGAKPIGAPVGSP
jgi:hypothetical protein